MNELVKPAGFPTIVCLCGSTRFGAAFCLANIDETLAGKIVLTIGCSVRADDDLFGSLSEVERAAVKARPDELHLRKIDAADEVLILNVGGYIGDSTRRELLYALRAGKDVGFLDAEAARETVLGDPALKQGWAQCHLDRLVSAVFRARRESRVAQDVSASSAKAADRKE